MIGLHKSHVMGCVISFKLEPMIDPTFQGRPSMCQPFTNYFLMIMILMSIMSQRHTMTLLISGGISCPSLGGKVHLAHQPQLSDVLRQIFSRGDSQQTW